MSLLIQLEFKVKPENETEFVRVARALAAASATEKGTLRYEWFVSPTPGQYGIIEEYVDADAAEVHNQNVEPLLREAFAVVELLSASFYGELNPYIRDWITGRDGMRVYTRLDAKR